jgi:hypothetical protein
VDDGRHSDPASAEDAPPLTFRRAAPHSVIDAVCERVFQAGWLHGALRANLPSLIDADAVRREELSWSQ